MPDTPCTILCLRADAPGPAVPGSVEVPCAACGAAVTLSPASRAAAGPGCRPICLGCGPAEMAASGRGRLAPLTRSQVDELLPLLAREN